MNGRALDRDRRAFYGYTIIGNGTRLFFATDGENSVYYDTSTLAWDAVEYHNTLNQN